MVVIIQIYLMESVKILENIFILLFRFRKCIWKKKNTFISLELK